MSLASAVPHLTSPRVPCTEIQLSLQLSKVCRSFNEAQKHFHLESWLRLISRNFVSSQVTSWLADKANAR